MNTNNKPKPAPEASKERLYITPEDLESLKKYRDANSNTHEIAEMNFKILDKLVTKIEKQSAIRS